MKNIFLAIVILFFVACQNNTIVEVNRNSFTVPLSDLGDDIPIDSVRVRLISNQNDTLLDTLILHLSSNNNLSFADIETSLDQNLTYSYQVYSLGQVLMAIQKDIPANEEDVSGILVPDTMATDSLLDWILTQTSSSSQTLSSEALSSGALSSSTLSSSSLISSSSALIMRKIIIQSDGTPQGDIVNDTLEVDPMYPVDVEVTISPKPGYALVDLSGDNVTVTPMTDRDAFRIQTTAGFSTVNLYATWGPTIVVEYPSTLASIDFQTGSYNLKKTETLQLSIASKDPKVSVFGGWTVTHVGSGSVTLDDQSIPGTIQIKQSAGQTILRAQMLPMWNTIHAGASADSNDLAVHLNQDGKKGVSLLYGNGSNVTALVLDSLGGEKKTITSAGSGSYAFTQAVFASHAKGTYAWFSLGNATGTRCFDYLDLQQLSFNGSCHIAMTYTNTSTTYDLSAIDVWGTSNVPKIVSATAASVSAAPPKGYMLYHVESPGTYPANATLHKKDTTAAATGNALVNDIAISNTGTYSLLTVAIQGVSAGSANPSMYLLRSGVATGALDTVTLPHSTGWLRTVVADPTDGWYVGGIRWISGLSTTPHSFIAKVNSDKSVTEGIYPTAYQSTGPEISVLRVLSSGKILVAGAGRKGEVADYGFAAIYSADLQTIEWSKTGLSDFYPLSAVEYPDGRIVLAGTSAWDGGSVFSLTIGPNREWPW